MIRNPVVAGMFYPGSASLLKQKVSEFVGEESIKEDVIGLVSPHAGYMYSGPVAGAVISRILFKDTFVIMGPNHTGLGEPFSIMTEGVWKTPMGDGPEKACLPKYRRDGSGLEPRGRGGQKTRIYLEIKPEGRKPIDGVSNKRDDFHRKNDPYARSQRIL